MLLSQQGFYFWVSFKRDFLFLGKTMKHLLFILWRRERTKRHLMSFLLAQMKELKKTSTPTEPPPILGGRNTGNRRNRRFPSMQESRDTAWIVYRLAHRDTAEIYYHVLKTRKLE